MPTGNTSLLGLALPVEGELSGTWGDVVNDSITSLVDSSVAGTTTLSADADVTLTDTVLAANQARQAIILWTASNGATTRNITAPARSKAYIVINAGTGSIVLRGAGPTTGVTVIAGERCLAGWNGSDFVKIATSTAATLTGTETLTNKTIEFVDGTAAAPSITNVGDTNTGLFFPAADTIAFAEGGAEVARFDASGNLGLGVVPSAWNIGGTAFEVRNGGNGLFCSGANTLYMLSNSFLNSAGDFKYVASSSATRYQHQAGEHRWYNAPSGTAGNTVTFTQAMTLDASGRLGIGSTSPTRPLTISAAGAAYPSASNPSIRLDNSASGRFALIESASDSNLYIVNGDSDNASTIFRRGSGAGNESFRFGPAGQLGVAGANYGTSGQVLTSQGSGSPPIWAAGGGGGGSAATPTALGTVYGATSIGSPFSTFLGYQAGTAITTGQFNTMAGWQSGLSTTSGSRNAFFGIYSGVFNTTGVENTFVGGMDSPGWGAGHLNTTGSFNTAIGTSALRSNTTASNNTAVGYQAGYLNTTGNSLVAVGPYALYDNTTGSSNVAVGLSSLENNTTGSNNVAVGFQAGFSNTTAVGQTHVGYQAGQLATGEWNTCIGNETGRTITTGIQNTMIGAYNGVYVVELTTGSYNITLGTYSGPSSSSSNYEMVIGYNVRGKGSSTGFISPNGGGVFQGNNSSSWSTTSDQRLKKNIADNNVGLEKLTQIQVRNFEYRLPEEVDADLKPSDAVQKTGVQLGVIAQELQSVLPECVRQESTGVLTVDTDNLTWYLINAVKELSARVKQLEGN